MAPSVASRGSGPKRNLIVCFLGGADIATRFDPTAIVLSDSGPASDAWYQNGPGRGLATYDTLLATALSVAEGASIDRVILVGFSRGCQAIRTHLMDGFTPDAIVAVDGVHSPIPPEGDKTAAWQRAVDAARWGGPPFLASHSCIVTEPGFMNCRRTLEMLTGWKLPSSEAIEPLGDHQSGNLFVSSWGGSTAEAHIYQGNTVLPMLIQRALTMRGGLTLWRKVGLGVLGAALGVGAVLAVRRAQR